MLTRYREELERPIQEAAEFFSRVETQLDSLAGELQQYFLRLLISGFNMFIRVGDKGCMH